MNALKMIKRDFKMFLKLKAINRTYKSMISAKAKDTPYINKPGIVLSFDDSLRVKHWYTYGKNLFDFHEIKATFNINGFLPFENRLHTQEEIDMLIELQHNGHELVHHGYKHEDAVKYSKAKGKAEWVQKDIVTLIQWMDEQIHSITKEKMKSPVSFAFPFSSYDEDIISSIVPKYFKICRGHLNPDKYHDLVSFERTGFVPSICIDANILPNVKFIKPILKLAKNTGSNVIFMFHSILPEEVDWKDFNWGDASLEASEYRISPKSLSFIINEAKKLELEFYTLAEIGGVATFIDPNLERAVRENLRLKGNNEKWILIKNLIDIKSLDLSNRNITNLSGVEYFLDLEQLDLSNNNLTDIRLLSKLKKLKVVNLKNNNLDNSCLSRLSKNIVIIL